MLLVAGQIESYMLGQDKGALHEINDQLDIVRPVTKWCRRVLKVEDIPGAIHEAMRQMQTGRPRPTLVEVPPDVLATVADVTLPNPSVMLPCHLIRPISSVPPRCSPRQRTADLGWWGCHCGGRVGGVTSARRSSGRSSGHHARRARGRSPKIIALALGVGYYGHGAPSYAAPRADVILAVGTRLTGQMRGPTAPRAPQRLIHLDVDASVIGKNYPAEVALVGHAKPALQMLLEAVRTRQAAPRALAAPGVRGDHPRE